MSDFKTELFSLVAARRITAAEALTLLHARRAAAPEATGAVAEAPSAPALVEPIAVIGMAGRYPGAPDLAALDQLLARGGNAISEGPAGRPDWADDTARLAKLASPWGGFLDDIDAFDPLFFNLSGQEAELMDPQQRLFLETAWHALEDAGYAPDSLAGSRTGVFVGTGAGDYLDLLQRSGQDANGQAFMGNSPSILSGRVSYFLDLVGPSVSVDTACSSSLVAVHLACESLRSGASELALAGGVCVLTSPQLHVMASKAGMLSRRGRCAAFDAGADGFVPGEGVGVVVLKPLSRALAAGDAVRGVILGSGMNQDGRTNGLTAPSGRAQARLVREVLARSGVAASSIGYVETHGTGTRLGDPIEVAALAEAFGPGLGRGVCALGSVKSNIGHTLTAAGVAGLLKVLLGLRRAELFPSLHFAAGNPEIDWNGPFFVNTQRRRWEPAGGAAVRRAAVSSFGFSGTNCHLVVEEAPAVAARPAARGPRLVVLSGRSAAAVRQRRADLLAWLEGPGATARLEDVAHTLGAGRSHFGWRQWWVVEDLAGLRSALSAAGEPVRAAASETVAAARPGLDAAGLSALGAAYAAGARLDWAGLVAGESPQRLSLPGYPFERRRYWAASRPGEPAVPAAAPVASAAPAPVAVPVALPAAVPAAAPVAIASPAPVAAPVAPAVALPEGATAAGPVTLLVRDWVAAPAAAEQPVAGPVLVLACGAVVPPAALAGLADWTLVGDAAAQAALGAARFVALDPWEAASGAAAAAALAEHPAATLLDLMDVAPMDMAPPGPQAPAGTPPGTPAGTPLGTPAGIPPGTPAGTLPGAAIPWGRIVLLQALLRRGGLRRLLHVTRGGQGFGLAPGRLEGALLRSLVLAAGQEERLPAASVDCEPEQALPLAALLGRAETGEVAYRAGGRFLRRLRALAEVPAAAPAPLPAERPCVISGGSGDLGQTLAWHLLRQGARRLVLLGRRPRAALAAAIAALEQAGAQVAYYAGPLAEAPLRAFLAGLEAEWGAQYGTVLHCAGQVPPLGRFAERSVAAMAATLEPKLEGSALLWRLLGERAERFVLFSSISGSGPALAAGLADYAAANAWQDAFARQQQGAAARVVALGWGSWGETGRSAGAQARRYLDERGILAMSTAAALGAFEQALASGAAELVVSRMGPAYAALAPVSPPPALAAPAWLGSLQGRLEGWARAAAARAGARLEPATLAAVAALEAHSLGRLGEALGLTPGAVRRDLVRLAVAPRHERLLASWLARLRQAGDWRAAAAAAGPALAAPPWQAHLALLESCLAGYPRLLADAVPATELLFAGASPERVAAVYAGDPLADAHHQAMAELVRQVVAARLAAGVAPVRVLEVGAGTGGTSGFVLAALAELGGGVEYHYTDLSPALLQWARQRHAGYGFARFFVLDAEAAPAAAEPRYDLILASNVVHATRRLERTLGGLKARLKGHGTLLLAEMTAEQTYAAMTFGLLEGWWRFEDAARRLGESPLASVAQWRQLLAECGFRCEVLGLAPGLPQSLLVCESDGLHDASPDTAAAMSAAVPAGATAAVPADAAAAVPADAAAAVPADAAAAVPADAAAAIGPELLEVAAAALKVAATELALDQPVGQYGIDSILAVDLIARLNEHFGVELRSTDLFNHATFGGVAAEILRLRRRRTTQPSPAASAPPATPAPAEVASATPAPAEASTPAAPAPARPATRTAPAAAPAQDDDDDAVAIIGLAGRFPGAADPDAFWANLAAGRDSIAPPGPRRTGWAGWTGARCGLLDDIDGFDAAFFQIAPREIADPRQRLVLEECWKALESAGQTEARLSGRACGVYIGVERGETPDATDFRATLNSLIPARIGFALNLKGPCLAVDTACSSSLVAVQLAWEAVRHGTCELALAGGVHLMPSPATLQALGPSGMLSPSGVCRPFDAQADGMVLAEGVGLVVLKRLRQALAEGDPIRAVIRGAALNYDGRTSSVTAPSAPSQAALQRQIYHRFGLDPASFGLVEAHGTGTPLGDPIELQALAEAFADFTPQRGFCALASVKANIGHAAAASGIAGLIKLVLALEDRQIPPQLHFHTPNPALRLAETPFHVPTHLQGWPRRDGQPRRAAISSFGASGTNCHMVLEEAPDRPEPNPAEPPGPWLVPLSAKTAAALARRLHDLRDWLRRPHPHSPSLARISHTLARRRSHFPQRWIAIAHTTTDLAEQLDRALRHTPDAIAQHPPTPSGHPNLDHAARLYHQGHTPDWDSITTQHTLTTIPLPTYPFERQGQDQKGRLFRKAWTIRPPAAVAAPPRAGRMLALLRPEQEADILPALPGVTFDIVRLPASDDQAVGRATVEAAWPPATPIIGCVDVSDIGASGEPAFQPARLGFLQGLIARHHAARTAAPFRLLHLTRGLQAFRNPRPHLAGAWYAGLVRLLGAEYGRIQATTVDLDARSGLAAALAAELGDPDPVSEVCYRDGQPCTPVLEPVTATIAAARPLQPEAVYLVAGGLRGLGATIARHLVRQGARKLALLGREPLPPRDRWDALLDDAAPDAAMRERIALVRDLEGAGVVLRLHGGDLSDAAGVAAFLDEVRRTLGPIRGAVHGAGAISTRDPALLNKSAEDCARVLAPKVAGGLALVRALQGDALDFLILFSSVSGIVPALAVSALDYASANAFLDTLAAAEQAHGRGAVRAIQWPAWAESDKMALLGGKAAELGLSPLSTAEALAIFDQVRGLEGTPVVLPMTAAPDATALSRLLGTSRAAPPTLAPTAKAPPMPDTQDPQRTRAWLRDLLARELQLPPGSIDPDANFDTLGVDSIFLASLVRGIETQVGQPLEPTTILEHPTLNRLAAHLGGRFPDAFAAPALPAAATVTATVPPLPAPAVAIMPAAGAPAPIAVIGLACRFPQAPDLDSFWRNLRAGHDAITEVPRTRWDSAALYSAVPRRGRSISKWGGFLDQIDQFDPEAFRIPVEEAAYIDPAQRLFLEVGTEALRHAGYGREELAGSETGIFVGARTGAYAHRFASFVKSAFVGAGPNFTAALLSDLLDLHGPSLVVDTACSSALVALHLACQSLRAGDCTMALAGGVELLLDERPYLLLSEGGALSPTGRCRTFDSRADGIVPGEGGGAVLLKPLADALRDGDRIHAVIESSFVNNDGHTMGITTPNHRAQQEAVRRCLQRGRLDPRSITYFEAHGTGTLIGDPIELRSLTEAWRAFTTDRAFCRVGSVKSNLGHLMCAAGIAGLVKIVLAMQHRELPPTLHCEAPNSRFRFDESPFRPVLALEPWEPGPHPRRAGINAFGFGGTNCTVVLREAPAEAQPLRQPLPPPRYDRRRFWIDAPAAAEAAAPPAAEAIADEGRGLEAFLDFTEWSGSPRSAQAAEPRA